MKTVIRKAANIVKEEIEKTLENTKRQLGGVQQSSQPPPNFYPEVNPEDETRAKAEQKRAFEHERDLEQEIRQITSRRDQEDLERLQQPQTFEEKARPMPQLPSSGKSKGPRFGRKPKQQSHDVEIRKGPTG